MAYLHKINRLSHLSVSVAHIIKMHLIWPCLPRIQFELSIDNWWVDSTCTSYNVIQYTQYVPLLKGVIDMLWTVYVNFDNESIR